MKFGKIDNLYAIRILGDKFIDQTGNVHYKDKEPDIRMVKDADVPQDIRLALESVLLAEKKYDELHERLKEAENAKKDTIESLKNLSKETLCTAKEFIKEFYDNIPDDIKRKYFNEYNINDFIIGYNDNLYRIESNLEAKYMGVKIIKEYTKTIAALIASSISSYILRPKHSIGIFNPYK